MLNLNGKTYEVPAWIISKNLSNAEAMAWNSTWGVDSIERETEKAILVGRNTDYGKVTVWCPKSALQDREEMLAQEEASNERWKNNQRYTNYLKETAKENGVKIGNMSSWEKIIAKLQSKGVEVKTREEFAA